MANLISIATDAVTRWERKAKGETYLDALLHPKAKGWLVDEIVAAMLTADASDLPGTLGVPEARATGNEKSQKVQQTGNKATTALPQPRLNTAATAIERASSTAGSRAGSAPARKPAVVGDDAEMEALKGRLKGQFKGQSKGNQK